MRLGWEGGRGEGDLLVFPVRVEEKASTTSFPVVVRSKDGILMVVIWCLVLEYEACWLVSVFEDVVFDFECGKKVDV